jgi:hypothetical protein
MKYVLDSFTAMRDRDDFIVARRELPSPDVYPAAPAIQGYHSPPPE